MVPVPPRQTGRKGSGAPGPLAKSVRDRRAGDVGLHQQRDKVKPFPVPFEYLPPHRAGSQGSAGEGLTKGPRDWPPRRGGQTLLEGSHREPSVGTGCQWDPARTSQMGRGSAKPHRQAESLSETRSLPKREARAPLPFPRCMCRVDCGRGEDTGGSTWVGRAGMLAWTGAMLDWRQRMSDCGDQRRGLRGEGGMLG